MGRKNIDDTENDEEFRSVEAELIDEDEAYVAETSGYWEEDEYLAEEGPGDDDDEESTYDPYEEDEDEDY